MSKLKYHELQTVILPDTPPERVNGIFIPTEARKPTNTGTIISIEENPDLKEGDKVFYNHRTGYIAECQDVNYLSINRNFILGIIKDNIMHPLHTRIIVEPIKEEEKISNGVVLLEDNTYAKGKIIATGNGTESEKMELEVGDIAVYNKRDALLVFGKTVLNQSQVIFFEEEPVNEVND